MQTSAVGRRIILTWYREMQWDDMGWIHIAENAEQHRTLVKTFKYLSNCQLLKEEQVSWNHNGSDIFVLLSVNVTHSLLKFY
jgi:hypothetical protein